MASIKKTVDGVSLEKTLKKYQLVAGVSTPFLRKHPRKNITDDSSESDEEVDVFQFRIRYGVDGNDGERILRARDKCPVFTIPAGGIVQTENPEAQQMLENFIAPTRTERNGAKRADGHMFVEYKGQQEADVDLDFHLL